MRISNPAFLGENVRFLFNPDGYAFGGEIRIGSGTRISDGVIIAPYGGRIHIGENVFIGPYSVLYGHGGLKIGSNTLIAAHAVFIPANHTFENTEYLISHQPVTALGIEIGEDVWIGSGARILDGVNIGKGCVIGAGAVVNISLGDYSIAVGVPARVVGMRKVTDQVID